MAGPTTTLSVALHRRLAGLYITAGRAAASTSTASIHPATRPTSARCCSSSSRLSAGTTALQHRLAATRQPHLLASNVPSNSTLPPVSSKASRSSFHTSAISHEKKAKRVARMRKKANLQRRESAREILKQTTPDPVRGYGPNNAQLWEECELKRILLTKEEVWSGQYGEGKEMLDELSNERDERLGPVTTSGSSLTAAKARGPSSSTSSYLNFGLAASDAELLFKQLPQASAYHTATSSDAPLSAQISREESLQAAREKEAAKADALARITDLRNANARGIRFENTRRIVRTFGQGQGTGRTEVQVAILTMRIHTLADRLEEMPRDVFCKRYLRKLVMNRAKLLKYLKRLDLQRYVDCLKDIGVEQRAVEGEIILH